MSTKNYGSLILAVLSEGWHVFGRYTPDNEQEAARWVQRRVRMIMDGEAEWPDPPDIVKPVSVETKPGGWSALPTAASGQ